MNKVHSIEKEIPQMEESLWEKKSCKYLYIEANEDHIHKQKDGKEKGYFMGKMISPFYFGGLYAGTDRVCKLRCFIWNYGRKSDRFGELSKRERELSVTVATGTDEIIEECQRKRYTKKQIEILKYTETLQATLA